MTDSATPPRSALASNKLAVIAVVVVVFGGLFAAATLLGPENPSAKSCFETEFEHDEQARIDPLLREKRFRHLAWDFVACRDGCDDENVAASCSTVAVIYAGGKGLRYEGDVDLAKAEEYASKACTLRGEAQCASAARYHCRADPAACEARCREGQGTECVTLAQGIDAVGGKEYDPARALELHGLACKGGVTESCDKERQLLCASQPVQCAERCKAGEAALCFELGTRYRSGGGELVQDAAKGIGFQRKGCELDAAVSDQCAKILQDAKIEL